MAQKVLITGATGLIGQRLSGMLLEKGIACNYLGRSARNDVKDKRINSFQWDVEKGLLDERAFEGVSTIIHLAGAGVAEKRWADSRKKEIIDSRVKSAGLLHRFLKKGNHEVKTFISASAVGYYGDCGAETISEDHQPGKDFLADVCKKWEQGAIKIGALGLREIRCRIGIVLAPNGGALPELTRTLPIGFANYFTKNDLYYPWIHIDDVCGIMMSVLENEMVSGPFNTTAPNPLLMKELMRHIIAVKKPGAALLPAPSFALKLALGEMSSMLLGSQRCSNEKILKTGYKFRFGDIEGALKDVFRD